MECEILEDKGKNSPELRPSGDLPLNGSYFFTGLQYKGFFKSIGLSNVGIPWKP